MKLHGETSTNMREFFPFLRKSRVAPEQNGGTLSSRHLECEEGTYDGGIISKFLRKVGALSNGESNFFRTRTYNPQRRSKSQERGSTGLPIQPFCNGDSLPVLRNFKSEPTTQTYKRLDSCDARRLSHPNVLPSSALQLAKQNFDCKSKDTLRKSDDLPSKSNPVCTKDIKPTVPPKVKPENNKCLTSEVPLVSQESTQLNANSAVVPSVQSEKEVKDAIKLPLPEDGSKYENGDKGVDVSNMETVNGVTRIQVKYSAPENQVIKPQKDNLEISNKNAVKLDSNAKLTQHENSKDIISESINFSGYQHSAVVTTTNATKPENPLIPASPSPTIPPYASSLRSVNAAKPSSKSNRGRLTIRPASNLNASKLKAEFLKLTEFNDIKVGEFSAPTKPKRHIKPDEEMEEEDDDLLIINETRAECGMGNDNADDEDNIEFIGAGIIQGKSSLAKTKSNKRRSVNFSESPVIHFIEDLSTSQGGGDDGNGADSFSYPDEAPSIFSSLTSAASTGGLSSYKSKSLVDFEFDFEDPPRLPRTTSGTCREEVHESSSQEANLWSSSGSLDLLF